MRFEILIGSTISEANSNESIISELLKKGEIDSGHKRRSCKEEDKLRFYLG
jgi:hypothetical protein